MYNSTKSDIKYYKSYIRTKLRFDVCSLVLHAMAAIAPLLQYMELLENRVTLFDELKLWNPVEVVYVEFLGF